MRTDLVTFPAVKFHRSTGTWWLVAVMIVGLVSACNAPSTPTPTPPPSPPSLPVDPANVVSLPAPAAAPSSTTDPIVGRYTLEIVAGSASGPRCGAVPDYAKRRTYTADIHDLGGSYAVKLYDATFLRDGPRIGYGCSDRRLPPGGVCNQFLMMREGNFTVSVTMTPEDDWRGSEIWEVLPDGYLLAIHGHATGSAGSERIEASGTGGVWYGNGIPASNFAGCSQGDLHLNFTRR
jgi:hypothetical protein